MKKEQLGALLAIYDQGKSQGREVFGDHTAIEKLRLLYDNTANDDDWIPSSWIEKCFSNDNSRYINTLSDAVRFVTGCSSREMEFYRSELINVMRSEENRSAILTHDSPRNVADALTKLDEANILDAENRAAILGHVDSSFVADALIRLNKAAILDGKNRAAILKNAHPDSAADALVRLNEATILNEENRAPVVQHADPRGVASALIKLNEAHILDSENRAAVLRISSNFNAFCCFLNALSASNILNQENFNKVLQNTWLLTQKIRNIFWEPIPNHLFTQTVFDEVLRLKFDAENPEAAMTAIRAYVDGLLYAEDDASAINGPQSTHTPSVRASVSQSVLHLQKIYGDQIAGKKLHSVIEKLTGFIMQLPVEPEKIAFAPDTTDAEKKDIIHKRKLAKKCLPRILEIDFKDGVSNTTMQEMLALCFIAVNDQETILHYAAEKISDPEEKKRRLSDEAWKAVILESSVTRFIEGFYEIDCIYNLNAKGERVVAGEDKSSCTGGTFNKPIECLAGVHPSVEVIFMTQETAAAKLPKVVMEQAVKYVFSQPNPMALIAKIKEEGIDCIWAALKPGVSEQMFEEFAPLYKKIDDPNFVALIASGQDVEAPIEGFLQEIASPIVCRAIQEYGVQLSNPKTAQEFLAFICLANELKKNNMQHARDQISARIAGPLFDKVKSFYPRGETDPSFIQLVKKVSEINRSALPDLDHIRQNILSSEGYRQYCSQLLSQRMGVFAAVDSEPTKVESDAAKTNLATIVPGPV